MAKPEDIRVGACLVHKQDRNGDQPLVIRCDPDDNDMFLTYDGENDVYKILSLQEIITEYDCVDHVPEEDCEDDVKRYNIKGIIKRSVN